MALTKMGNAMLKEYNICMAIIEIHNIQCKDKETIICVKVGKVKKSTRFPRFSGRPYLNEVYQPRSHFMKKKRLGSTEIDISYVWAQADHKVTKKWVALTDPIDLVGQTKGFIKCNVRITTQHEARKCSITSFSQISLHDTIERNLIVPENCMAKKLKAYYIFQIYRGQGSSKFNENTGSNKPLSKSKATAYVKVTYAGLTTKTSTIKNSLNMCWNEELEFTDIFPPLYNRVRFDFHLGKCKATRYIYLSDISDPHKIGFLPTFGPSFVHFYSSNNYYFGSLLLAIETKTVNDFKEKMNLHSVLKNRTASIKEDCWDIKEFLLFGVVYGVTMIKEESIIESHDLWMTLNFGVLVPELVSSESKLLLTPEFKSARQDKNYRVMLIGSNKPCLYEKCKMTDCRLRAYNTNAILSIGKKLKKKLLDVARLMELGHKCAASKLLKQALLGVGEDWKRTSKQLKQGDTKLDQERFRLVHLKLSKEIKEIENISPGAKFSSQFDRAQELMQLMYDLADDPQDSFPLVVLSLWRGMKLVAQHSLPAWKILHSNNEILKGSKCGFVHTALMKGAKEHLFGAKLRIFLWLGETCDYYTCLSSIPPGFRHMQCAGLPQEILYVSHTNVLFKAHIYSGCFFGEGPCSTFVKVFFADQCECTKVVIDSSCPTWNQTLLFKETAIEGIGSCIKSHPLVSAIEIWNEDSNEENRRVGHFLTKPHVILKEDNFIDYPPSFQWFKIRSEQRITGEMLAMFEIIEFPENKQHSSSQIIHKAVNVNKTPISKYRIKIQFWGLREERVHKTPIKSPKIEVNCGTATLYSDVMKNISTFPNFEGPAVYADTEINDMQPPLMIKLSDKKSFGITSYIGRNVTKNIRQFMIEPLPPSPIDSVGFGDPVGAEHFGYKFFSKKCHTDEFKSGEAVPLLESEDHGDNAVQGHFWPFKFLAALSKQSACQIRGYKKEEPVVDWWSKYYASVAKCEESGLSPFEVKDNLKHQNSSSNCIPDEKFRTPLPRRLSLVTFEVYENELEKQVEFEEFKDILKTFDIFPLETGNKIKSSDAFLKLKAGVYIHRLPLPRMLGSGDAASVQHVFNEFALRGRSGVNLLVRTYVIKATGLQSPFGRKFVCPFLEIHVSSKSVSDSEYVMRKDSNPTFGRCLEIKANLPKDSLLTVRVMDWDDMGCHDVLGETVIDIENRFFSKHRGTCGIQQSYEIDGYNKWRDIAKPSQILEELCAQSKLNEPCYMGNSVTIGTVTFKCKQFPEVITANREHLALEALKNWNQIPKVGCFLVPEHIERRPLNHPEFPTIESGKLEMWVDLFSLESGVSPPLPVDITPKKPVEYVLRVNIWKTSKIKLRNSSGNEKAGKNVNIFVKGWLTGKEDLQKTDLQHHLSNKECLFNWRFIFPFSYFPQEGLMLLKKKNSSSQVDYKVPPILHLQIWNKENSDSVLGDHNLGLLCLGSIALDLRHLPNVSNGLKGYIEKVLPLKETFVNLFKVKRVSGTWPFTIRPPNDDSQDQIVGYVKAEFTILTKKRSKDDFHAGDCDSSEELEEPRRRLGAFKWKGYKERNRRTKLIMKLCTSAGFLILGLALLVILYPASKFNTTISESN